MNDIESDIDSVTSSILDLNNAIADIDLYIFEQSHERFQSLIDDLDTIRDLIAANGEEDWFDDEGMWTSKGTAVLGTYIQQYEMYKNALIGVNDELAKYQKAYKGNEADYKNLGIDSEQELFDKQRELIDQQKDYAKAISDTEISVKDMYESQIDAIEDWSSKAVDAYNDYIDVVKRSLDAERDLYEFKKNIEKQTKDIAELERKIASLSGSDNKADIAERRKLQKELFDAKEGLNDTYYDHAKSAQDEALDKENEAYAKSLENYTEKLRETLDQAQLNMEQFMQNVTASVMLNAETVRTEYTNTGIDIDVALTTPWDNAIVAMQDYEVDGLSQMNAWLSEDGYFGKFLSTATYDLTTPWGVGASAAKQFSSDVSGAMKQIVTAVQSNVTIATNALNGLSGKVSDVYKQILDTKAKADNLGGGNGNDGDGGIQSEGDENVKKLQKFLNYIFNAGLDVDGKLGPKTKSAIQKAQIQARSMLNGNWISINGKYDKDTKNVFAACVDTLDKDGNYKVMMKNYLPDPSLLAKYFAKGTLGTTKDQWAIDSEPQFGDELVLVPGKNGILSYMRKGTAVVPANLTENLMEWGQLNPNMIAGGSIIQPVVLNTSSNIANTVQITFDSLVKTDYISKDILPEVETMVSKQLNDFTRKLNYAIKKYK